MKFTQYLREQTRPERKASFIDSVKHDPLWPAGSNRLQDFETFLFARPDGKGEKLIPELRGLWRDYANQIGRDQGKHDLDLALTAWADYAQHRRECAGCTHEPCSTVDELFDAAMEASGFDTMPERPVMACDHDPEHASELVELFEDGIAPRRDALEDGDDFDDEDLDDLDSADAGEWDAPTPDEHEARC